MNKAQPTVQNMKMESANREKQESQEISVNVLAVFREPRFSFNAVEVDRAILIESVEALKKACFGLGDVRSSIPRSIGITYCEAEDLLDPTKLSQYLMGSQLVLSMAQSHEVIQKLQRFERRGIRVVNSTASVLSCYRNQMHQILKRARAGYPTSSYVEFDTPEKLARAVDQIFQFPESSSPRINVKIGDSNSEKQKKNLKKGENAPGNVNSNVNGYWIKRGDFHALQADDVVFASSLKQVAEILKQFSERGIASAVVQQHVAGDVYKVYGIPGLFFHLRWVSSSTGQRRDISEERVAECVMSAARLMELEVFGADCVVDELGEVHVIDMNDWPSFRVCREDAARAIARHCLGILDETVVVSVSSTRQNSEESNTDNSENKIIQSVQSSESTSTVILRSDKLGNKKPFVRVIS